MSVSLKQPYVGAGAQGASNQLTPDELRSMLTDMLLIRSVEDEVERLFFRGLVRGSTHLCQGQEAVAVGACRALVAGDTMTCTYRGHGAVLAKGLQRTGCLPRSSGRAAGCVAGTEGRCT